MKRGEYTRDGEGPEPRSERRRHSVSNGADPTEYQRTFEETAMARGGVPERETSEPSSDAITSDHVRRAQQGDHLSLEWVVKQFSPLLLAQAAWRLGPELRALYEPEDLVNEVWAVALPRLSELPPRDGRTTPVLLRFLATTLLYRVNNLVKKHVTSATVRRRDPADPTGSQLPAETTTIISRAVREEMRSHVGAAILELDPRDREVLVLRGIEQNSNETVALILGISPNAASMRYQRALQRLRSRLPASLLDDLQER